MVSDEVDRRVLFIFAHVEVRLRCSKRQARRATDLHSVSTLEETLGILSRGGLVFKVLQTF